MPTQFWMFEKKSALVKYLRIVLKINFQKPNQMLDINQRVNRRNANWVTQYLTSTSFIFEDLIKTNLKLGSTCSYYHSR